MKMTVQVRCNVCNNFYLQKICKGLIRFHLHIQYMHILLNCFKDWNEVQHAYSNVLCTKSLTY